MRSYRDLSIGHKLQGIVIATCALALLVAASLFAVYDRQSSLLAKTQDLEASAKMVGSNSTAALTFGDRKSAQEVLSALEAKLQVEDAGIFDKDGAIFATYSRGGTPFQLARPEFTGDKIVGRTMVVAEPITLNRDTIGTILIEADLSDVNGRMVRFVAIAALVFLVSLVVAFLLSARLQRVISRPIRELADTASSVSACENYSIRATKSSDDDIGVLYERFNEMLDRIQQRDAALQQAHDELERRVTERTAYLNALIENSPLAIVATDGNERIEMCNPAFETMFLHPRSDALGHALAELIQNPADDVSPSHAGREERVHEVTRRHRIDGSVFDVEILAVPLVIAGRQTGRLTLFQDVTERKRAEEAMQHAKEAAEAASRAKSEFLANMSHEIRTPMNGIMGMTELVLDTELDTEQRNYLNVAKVSADSLLSLINDILDYSKIEAGKLEIDIIDFNLRNCLGDTMKTLSLRAHQKGLELAFEIDPDVPDGLTGDPGRLRQIIVNLVGNAIKFTEHGEVVLHVGTESRTPDSLHLHFTVTDTGIGIPAGKQSAIFEAFEQADGSMTRKYGGTGLGLTISSRLVGLMGGCIWVESELGKGSRFHFSAGFGLQKVAARTVVPRDPETLRDMRVLVVDDNATNRQILVKMLENWHASPTAVESGAKAIVTLKEGQGIGRTFPMILLDAQMPEMDGFALAEAIKRNPEWRTATIMMLSSAGQRGDAIRCRELGVAAYLTKPVQQAELLDAILTALGTGVRGKPSPPLVTRHTLRENRVPLRILLVEDNAVNQLVALRLLEKYGHSVTLAVNGKKALAALEEQRYDLVLMDVQMPEMNGWEATRAIREKEKKTGDHMPIIAMTAHAMKGDEEKCLDAGMDSYLTKPILTQDLLIVLDEVGKKKADRAAPEEPASAKPALDFAAALERLEGDRELFEEVVQVFKSDCPITLKQLRQALNVRDAAGVTEHAHALKGSSLNLGAATLSQTAFEMERLGRSGDLGRGGAVLKVIEREVDRLFCELEAFSAR